MMRKSDRKTDFFKGAAVSSHVAFLLIFLLGFMMTACAGEVSGTGRAAPDTDWQTERESRDFRTRQDRRTEPEDETQVIQMDLDACQSQVLIEQSGDVRLFGSLQGQVVVDVDEDELVHLYLAGVDITSENGPAVLVREASKLIVTLVSGTENVLADSPNYRDYEETPACFYSVCDLTINGDGALSVCGYHGDGIRGRDRIKLLDCHVAVQAKGDGIRGNDGIFARDASVEVQSEKNGLRTANQGTGDRGVIEVNGGTLSVVAGKRGIYAAADLYLFPDTCSVNAVEEKAGAEGTAYIAGDCLEALGN